MTYNAVLCGCGAMAKGWLRAVRDTPHIKDAIEIVGLVDLDRATAEALATEFNLQQAVIGTDLEVVLAETRPDILLDVVIPNARHSVVSAGLAVMISMESLVTDDLRVLGSEEGFPALPSMNLHLLRNPQMTSPITDCLAEYIVEGFRL